MKDKIELPTPISYEEIVHVLRIETDTLEICKPKIIRKGKGIKGLFKKETSIVHMDENEWLNYWEV